ncbi:DUF4245 domain-containing protein [Microbacterium sp. 4R-513]|uniref:DUF4245 family protein n=1 Tax=Microbacterium sp. 4R-513 TaxID=2567934 RepID=UPI0013E18511|nr:DUF4245 family protein [Microbacterium sp. 4R-513]QIG40236.1 DUF4245 domain-containing protein [Microbacterium sp. 4R-513]
MARAPRIVAELGRPETPEETADRKAQFSAAYRSSQNTRNLIAALLATLTVVLIIVFAVPRGSIPEREPVDVASVAADVSSAEDRTVLVPDVPDTWRANSAAVEGDSVGAWTIVYVPSEASGYLRIAQGFDADAAWPTRVLKGADASGTTTIDGVEWTVYDIPDPARAGNVSIALSTPAGPDTVMIYGSTDEKTVETAAKSVADQVKAIAQDAQ